MSVTIRLLHLFFFIYLPYHPLLTLLVMVVVMPCPCANGLATRPMWYDQSVLLGYNAKRFFPENFEIIDIF